MSQQLVHWRNYGALKEYITDFTALTASQTF